MATGVAFALGSVAPFAVRVAVDWYNSGVPTLTDALTTILSLVVLGIVVGVAAGLGARYILSRRKSGFSDLSDLMKKIRNRSENEGSLENTLRLIGRTQQVMPEVKRVKFEQAFGKAFGAFLLVAIVGSNVGLALIAGIIVYLYFIFEASEEFQAELHRFQELTDRFEAQKAEFMKSL